jgi:predicted metallopeptidase
LERKIRNEEMEINHFKVILLSFNNVSIEEKEKAIISEQHLPICSKFFSNTQRRHGILHERASVQALLAEDLSQILEGYVEFIKRKAWKPIS